MWDYLGEWHSPTGLWDKACLKHSAVTIDLTTTTPLRLDLPVMLNSWLTKASPATRKRLAIASVVFDYATIMCAQLQCTLVHS